MIWFKICVIAYAVIVIFLLLTPRWLPGLILTIDRNRKAPRQEPREHHKPLP